MKETSSYTQTLKEIGQARIYINENKVLLTTMDVVQQLHQAPFVHNLAQIIHTQNDDASMISPL
jgi:hypothetical protein